MYIGCKCRFSVAPFAVVEKSPNLVGALLAVNCCCQYRPGDNWIGALALHINSVSMKRLPSRPWTARVMDWLQDACRSNEGPQGRPYEGSSRTGKLLWRVADDTLWFVVEVRAFVCGDLDVMVRCY